VLDLATGAIAWTADGPGVPIDVDGTSLLVRRHTDTGDLALLDFTTGRQRWTAPDAGLPGTLRAETPRDGGAASNGTTVSRQR
jgi:hypothetical protein